MALLSSRNATIASLALAVLAGAAILVLVSNQGSAIALTERGEHGDPYLAPRAGAFLGKGDMLHQSHLESHDEKRKRQQEAVHKALHHLSSTALVQRAASECAQDAKCVPSVDELVKRAASACAKDPACICDWGRYPKQCFLSEVQRHEQLVRAAKQLERNLHQREEAHVETKTAVTKLEENDKEFATVLGNGQRSLEGGEVEDAKHALAKAEYLHEVMVHTGGQGTPAEERQEEELKRFARDVVEKEAHMPSGEERRPNRPHHDRDDRSRARRGENKVERQLSTLTKNVETLMKAVGTVEQQRELKEIPQASSNNPRTKMQQLAQEVGVLSGKLNSLEHNSDGHVASTQGLEQDGRGSGEAKVRAMMLSHQESAFAQAIAHGEKSAFDNRLSDAREALREARYYHSEIVRLRGLSPAAPCPACLSLSRTIHRVALNSNSRTSSLFEQHHARADASHEERPSHEAAHREERTEREDRTRGRERGERRRAEERRDRREDRRSEHEERRDRREPSRDQPPSSHQLEMRFDTALSSGERDLLKGSIPAAVQQDEKAKRDLHKLDQWTLAEHDGLVKNEMKEALESFTKGVEHRGGVISGADGRGEREARHKEDEHSRRGGRRANEREVRERDRGERRERHVEEGRRGRAVSREPVRREAEHGDKGAAEGSRQGEDKRNVRQEPRAAEERGRAESEKGAEGGSKGAKGGAARGTELRKEVEEERAQRERLPAYRKVSWKQVPPSLMPHAELNRIYSHFSES